ncbi:hypothetical protein CHUAL_009405 [Chamberlinius hualienensis]
MDSNEERSDFFEIDGSQQEGGGQILRFSVAISAIMKRPIRVFNIRGGRSKPGLSAQHLKGLELVKKISQGELSGASIGSREISFKPGKLSGGHYEADTETAGSVALLIQVALPCLLFADGESSLLLKGGTDADFAPPIDYTLNVFNPILKKFGITYELMVVKRGFYPKGGGIVKVNVKPLRILPIPAINLTERGDISLISGCAHVAGTVKMMASHAMAEGAITCLRNEFGHVKIVLERIRHSPELATGNGGGVIVIAETTNGCFLAGSALLKPNIPWESIGANAGEILVKNLKHNGCVDDNLQDQLIIFMALAEGKSRIKCGPITLHTKSVINLAHQLTKAKFNIEPVEKNSSTFYIECEGHGLTK